MLYSFIFFYVIGAIVFCCRTSIIAIKSAIRISSQMHLTEKKREKICINYIARILFQTVMMIVFPISFGFYITISNYFGESLVVTSGLFTVIWLIITGILIKLVYYLMTHKIKSIKVFDCDRFFQDKEFFWVMCPILYGILFNLYDKTIFFEIFAIVLGKYLWMDSFRKISLSNIKIKLVELFEKFKLDIRLLVCQALVMGYLLVRWYPVKDELIKTGYIFNTFLLAVLFLMPIIDLLIFSSVKSYAEFSKEQE